MVSTPRIEDVNALAIELADMAQDLSLRYFRKPIDVDHKQDDSPVTVADREIEAAMRAHIQKTFPDHGLFGEEHGKENPDAECLWILDPIDGTKSFITGMPLFATLIAYVEHSKPVLGIVGFPGLGERWVGMAGHPTRFNGEVCKVSACTSLAEANIYTTSPDFFDEPGLVLYEKISRRARMRRYGGDSYPQGLLASGHVDAVMEMSLKPYDYMAVVPVVEGAGGVMTDWQGQPLDENSDGRVLSAATPELHQEILSLINSN